MLSRAKKALIPATLTITGQGEEPIKFNVTFHNRKASELAAVVEDKEKKMSDVIVFLVSEWEAEYPLTVAGVEEMEDDRPGMVYALMEGYHDARRVQRAKNSERQ